MQRPHYFAKRRPADVNYETPGWLYDLLDREFHFTHDLAAVKENAKAPFFRNSLRVDWHKLDGWLWLNPPFAGIRQWIEKAAREARLGAKIVVLVPATVLGAPYMSDCHPRTVRFVSRCPTFRNTFTGKVVRFMPVLLIYGARERGLSFAYQPLEAARG